MPLEAATFAEPNNLRGTAGGACVAIALSGSMFLALYSIHELDAVHPNLVYSSQGNANYASERGTYDEEEAAMEGKLQPK